MIEASIGDLQLSAMVFARIAAMVFTMPVLSARTVPAFAKIGLAAFAAAAVVPSVADAGYPMIADGLQFTLTLAGETLIGMLIGLFITIGFSALQMAGQMASLHLGFGAAEVFDPLSQEPVPLIGQFFHLMAVLVFLSTGAFHKLFLLGVSRSFSWMRPSDLAGAKTELIDLFIRSLGGLLQAAMTIALPILGVMLLVQVALSLLTRTVPQMDSFVLGLPVSIGVGLVVLAIMMPFLLEAFALVIDGALGQLGIAFDVVGGQR